MNWQQMGVELGMTVLYSVVGFLLFGLAILILEKVSPFSIRKEIEEDQNVALGIVMGCGLIAMAVLIGSVIVSG